MSPGYFRTNFLEGSSLATPKNAIEDYKAVRDVQAAHENDINNNQPGDPDKAAAVMIEVASMAQPPLHLFLGPDSYNLAELKIQAVQKDLEAVRQIATATNFDN